ncbi:chemotaxis response regulator protein-glutamate methylesterase [Bacillus sp. FJAT-26390]|uniref:protein-glutamate methylesterase/protein-glutamine glutaminase n=1 Tax=Bacillus sp. FJAT-26390 TaxID=1743142 RepID=UPI000AAA1D73|nr:chemotaxis response regulator protein-glutamate methylesterase [Bacillus sp. FJAT-26390]
MIISTVDKRIRVLVVDDSIMFREVLARGLATDPFIEVVATAKDPFDARDKIIQYKPDVLTCDIEMPGMNGIEFIRRLLPQYPLPIVTVSSISVAALDALRAGAVDFVAKPDIATPQRVEQFLFELIRTIKGASKAKIIQEERSEKINETKPQQPINNRNHIIVVGASTGGTEAMHTMLKGLPANAPGMVVVQHIPPIFSRMFAERLNASCAMQVKEAEDGDFVQAGTVLIAPGDKHVSLVKAGDRYKLVCRSGEKVNGHCPSVDVLFESASKAAGDRAIGIILTGMGKDGARGLLSMRTKGSRTIGQDEKTSIVYGMPKAAYELGAVEIQSALPDISRVLLSLLS